MKNYFEGKDGQLREVLTSWLYTPYRHWMGVKGVGVDCIHFVTGVYTELGVEPEGGYHIQFYGRDWNLHSEEELLLTGVVSQIAVEERPLLEPENGNLFLFRFGKTISHSAIYLDGALYQAVTGQGVLKMAFKDRKWHRRKRYNYRIVGDKGP